MLFEYAKIHGYKNAGSLGFLRCGLIDDAFLHPHRWNFQLNRLIDNLFHVFWAAKDIYNVDLLRNFQ